MTAPALPGAAPDPDRLPPEVERAIGKCCDAHGAYATARERGTIPQIDKAFKAAESAEAALRTAIARALGGDGEPVAWGVVSADGVPASRPHLTQREAEFMAKTLNEDPDEYAPYRAEALFTRPAATGDTGEGGGALIGEAFDLIGHVVNHARRSTNIDGTRRRLGDDEACGRNWIALVDKCEALLATRAATGGPDAR